MKEKPILFSAEMVRAILAGRKTQTRRVIKPQPNGGIRTTVFTSSGIEDIHGREIKWAYEVGDRLWVRETWAVVPRFGQNGPIDIGRLNPNGDGDEGITWRANWNNEKAYKWRPSIHMPRWASRITLEITDVWAERLQDISESDAQAEGMDRGDWTCPGLSVCGGPSSECHNCMSLIKDYAALWDKLNAKRGFGWDMNPWVWVIEFKRIGEERK